MNLWICCISSCMRAGSSIIQHLKQSLNASSIAQCCQQHSVFPASLTVVSHAVTGFTLLDAAEATECNRELAQVWLLLLRRGCRCRTGRCSGCTCLTMLDLLHLAHMVQVLAIEQSNQCASGVCRQQYEHHATDVHLAENTTCAAVSKVSAMICSQGIPEHLLVQGCEHAPGQLVVPFQLYRPLGALALLYGQGMQGQSADLLYAIYPGSRCTYTYGMCR